MDYDCKTLKSKLMGKISLYNYTLIYLPNSSLQLRLAGKIKIILPALGSSH